ncbi:MAG: hypothetical protein PHZ19_02480 [Candidatus Thermoplasmatota archaeon]|nr:hypothetical protein [Candidatus Thermoplasmatota archaeon]
MESWPATLPQEFEVGGFSVTPANNVVRTQVDAGVPKRRRRFTKGVSTIDGKMSMDLAQYLIFKAFVASLNDGVDQFSFPRPGYCSGTIAVSLVPDKTKIDHLGGDAFEVALSLETLEDYLD